MSQVASVVGVFECIAFACITALLGTRIFRRQGAQLPLQLQRGEIEPTEAALETAALTFGALFLIVPGFLSDAVGLTLLIPPLRRALARRWSRRLFRSKVRAPTQFSGDDADIIVIKKNPRHDRLGD